MDASVPVGSVVAGVIAAFLGSLFAAGDAALTALPEPRVQGLAGGTGPDAAAFRRFVSDEVRLISRWLVARVIALSIAAALFANAAEHVVSREFAVAIAVVAAVFT